MHKSICTSNGPMKLSVWRVLKEVMHWLLCGFQDQWFALSDFFSQFWSDFGHCGVRRRVLRWDMTFSTLIDTIAWHECVKLAFANFKLVLKGLDNKNFKVWIKKPVSRHILYHFGRFYFFDTMHRSTAISVRLFSKSPGMHT